MKFKYWLESSYEDYVAEYMQIEPQLLSNKVVQDELTSTGEVRISTIQKILGISEGEATFYAREFNKRHENIQQQRLHQKQQDELDMKQRRDDFYYHVLPTKRLNSVLKTGLIPGKKPVFSNYTNHSKGKIFLCEKEGINFWKGRIEDHLFHNGEDENVSVVKIRKDLVKVEPDPVGASDSYSPSYYTISPIPPQNIQIT